MDNIMIINISHGWNYIEHGSPKHEPNQYIVAIQEDDFINFKIAFWDGSEWNCDDTKIIAFHDIPMFTTYKGRK